MTLVPYGTAEPVLARGAGRPSEIHVASQRRLDNILSASGLFLKYATSLLLRCEMVRFLQTLPKQSKKWTPGCRRLGTALDRAKLSCVCPLSIVQLRSFEYKLPFRSLERKKASKTGRVPKQDRSATHPEISAFFP